MRGFNPRTGVFRESPTRRIDRIREEAMRRGLDIIMLSTGQPSIPPPLKAREALARDLLAPYDRRLYSYTPSRGYSSVLEAVVLEMERWGVKLEGDQVTLTAGGQSALFGTVMSLVSEGDEVVVLDPMYFGYWPLLDYAGARVRIVETSIDHGFQPEEEKLKEAVSPKTRAIILVTPDNPTGRVISRETARLIADLAVDMDFWIIVDEAYRTLVYEGEHTYIYNYAPHHTIALNTFSKDPGIPGWRLGFAYGPKSAIERIRLFVQETVYCPPSVAQRFVEHYLRDEETRMGHLETVRGEYARRRDALLEAIDEMLPGARYVRPGGGMFVYVDLSRILRGKIDSEALAEMLLREKGVATVPGTYFSRRGEQFLRLSFVGEPPERLREAVSRMRDLLREKGLL